MSRVIHKVESKKTYFFAYIVIILFSALAIAGLFTIDIITGYSYERYFAIFVLLFITIFMITRKDINDIFQPSEINEIKHEVRK